MAAEPLLMEDLPPAERSMDDVLAGLIRFTLGGRPFAMATLPMGPHDRWQEALDADLQGSFDGIPNSGLKAVRAIDSAFRANRDRMLDALIAYDRDNVLPPRDEIRELATQQDIIAAIMEVRAVGGDPLGAGALRARRVMSRLTALFKPLRSIPGSGHSSGSLPSTAGPLRKSRKR